MAPSLHECPACDTVVTTTSTTAGAFEAPPKLFCVHDDGSRYEMHRELLDGSDTDHEVDISGRGGRR